MRESRRQRTCFQMSEHNHTALNEAQTCREWLRHAMAISPHEEYIQVPRRFVIADKMEEDAFAPLFEQSVKLEMYRGWLAD